MRNWLENKNVPSYLKNEIKGMNEKEYEEAFGTELAFGTAGVRGILGAGTGRLNIFTVRKITLGLARYLKNKYNDQEIKVIVGYDSRNFSVEFSESVAQILETYGIKTLIFDQVKPTPILSFGVRHYECQAGIMITASHNPKEYNGYKVYNETGCQVNIEEGNEIISYVDDVKGILDYKCKEVEEVINLGFLKYITDEIDEIYLEQISHLTFKNIEKKDIKVVFTPVAGTSGIIGPKTMKKFGYNNLIEVKEQMKPDGNFTNVTDANPENIECYDLAIKYAIKNNADIIVANDPDADRLGVMFNCGENEYKLLTGNQTGALLLDYILNNMKLDGNEVVYNTIVTGELGSEIVKSHNVELVQTLTGFKFIGEQIELNKEKKFIFGYEESYGYLLDECVRDKDSLQALVVVSEMANYYLNKGMTLGERLKEIYKKYGNYYENTFSITLSGIEGLKKIQLAMERFRVEKIDEVTGIKVVKQEDYLEGIGNLPKADVLKYYLEGKGWFALRPSGTEPKLKIYISIKEDKMEESIKTSNTIYKHILKEINKI